MNRFFSSTLRLALLLLAGSCSTDRRPQEEDPQQKRLEIFGDTIELEWKHDKRVLTYCPGHTCLRFLLPAKNSTKALIDFSYLYLYDVRDNADDPQLEAFKTSVTSQELREVVVRHQEDCLATPEAPIDTGAIRCVLRKMIPRHEIRAEEIRVNDRGTFSSELNLVEKLDSP
jgi:hypothetical protein